MVSTRLYELKARADGVKLTTDYPNVGLHNWNQFGRQLDKTKPRVLNVMNAW